MFDYYAEYDAWREAQREGLPPVTFLLQGRPPGECGEWLRTVREIHTLPETVT